MDVSVIIVNYNTLQLTENCINSIHDKTVGIEYEIILIDNASTDGSKDYFRNYKNIRYIYLSENIGFGKANNVGLKHAHGKYIFLLNSDTVLLNNAISIFFNYCETTTEKYGSVGGYLENSSGERIHSYGNRYNFYRSLLGPDLEPRIQQDKESIIVEYVTGADIFVKKDLLDTIGPFDPDFFMYSEEVELQYRFTKAGYPSRIIEGPRIIHYEGESFKSSNKEISIEQIVNKEIIKSTSKKLLVKKTTNSLTYCIFYICCVINGLKNMHTIQKKYRKRMIKSLVEY